MAGDQAPGPVPPLGWPGRRPRPRTETVDVAAGHRGPGRQVLDPRPAVRRPGHAPGLVLRLHPVVRGGHHPAHGGRPADHVATHGETGPFPAGAPEAATGAQAPAGEVQGRQAEAQRRDDEVLQGAQGQPLRGVPAPVHPGSCPARPVPPHPGPDQDIHRRIRGGGRHGRGRRRWNDRPASGRDRSGRPRQRWRTGQRRHQGRFPAGRPGGGRRQGRGHGRRRQDRQRQDPHRPGHERRSHGRHAHRPEHHRGSHRRRPQERARGQQPVPRAASVERNHGVVGDGSGQAGIRGVGLGAGPVPDPDRRGRRHRVLPAATAHRPPAQGEPQLPDGDDGQDLPDRLRVHLLDHPRRGRGLLPGFQYLADRPAGVPVPEPTPSRGRHQGAVGEGQQGSQGEARVDAGKGSQGSQGSQGGHDGSLGQGRSARQGERRGSVGFPAG